VKFHVKGGREGGREGGRKEGTKATLLSGESKGILEVNSAPVKEGGREGGREGRTYLIASWISLQVPEEPGRATTISEERMLM